MCMILLSQNPLTVSTTQQSTTYWTTTQSTASTTTTTTTTTTSTTTKPPVMLYNDHIVVSTDPDALAIYGSILSGTWEIPQGQEKKIFLCLYVEIIKVQHNHHRGRHGHGQQQRNHHQVKKWNKINTKCNKANESLSQTSLSRSDGPDGEVQVRPRR